MYPVEQGCMVCRGQWHWQVSGSHTLSAAIQSALCRVLLQTHLPHTVGILLYIIFKNFIKFNDAL